LSSPPLLQPKNSSKISLLLPNSLLEVLCKLKKEKEKKIKGTWMSSNLAVKGREEEEEKRK